MSTTQPSTTNSNPSILSTHGAIISSISSFLTISIHNLLYHRSIYPLTSFLSTRAYNFPVRQSRHPAVCSWIRDAIAAVSEQLLKCTAASISLVIYSTRTNLPLERYMFDLSQLPRVPEKEVNTPFEDDGKVSVADLEAQFRAVLSRLQTACARLKPLPKGEECSFTVCMELRDRADAPVGLSKGEQAWLAAEPEREGSESSKREGEVRGGSGSKTVPVRRVEAGELRMEVWVEEAKAKFADSSTSSAANPP